MEWVASPFSSISSWLRNQPQVSWIAGRFFTNWTIREAQANYDLHQFGKLNLCSQNENFCLSSLPFSTRMWSILKFMIIVTHTSLIRIFSPCIDCCLVARFDSLRPHGLQQPGIPVYHELLEFTQTQVHWVSDVVQPSHPLSSPSPPALSLSQHQGVFNWVSSLYQVAEVLEFQLQHQSFQWIVRTDFL